MEKSITIKDEISMCDGYAHSISQEDFALFVDLILSNSKNKEKIENMIEDFDDSEAEIEINITLKTRQY